MKWDNDIPNMKTDWSPKGIGVVDVECFIESKMWKAFLEILDFQRGTILEELMTKTSLEEILRLQGEYKYLEFVKTIPAYIILQLDPEYVDKQLKNKKKD